MTDTTRTSPSIRELPLAPGGRVEILLTANELRLQGTDADQVVVRTRGGRAIDDAVTIEAAPDLVRVRDGAGDALRIGPLSISSRHPEDLDIDVPRTAQVKVRTLSGDVEATRIGGESRWATASGELHLRVDAGPVSIETLSGDVTLDSSVPTTVNVSSVSGDVRLRAPRLDALGVSTTSGDVRVEAALGRDATHTFTSVSGDIDLATASAVRVDAQSVAGDLRASVPHRAEGGRGRRSIVVGDGSVQVVIRTMSGDVRVRPPAADVVPPEPPVPPNAPETQAPVPPLPPVVPEPPLPAASPEVEPPSLIAEAEAAPNLLRPAPRATADDEPRPADDARPNAVPEPASDEPAPAEAPGGDAARAPEPWLGDAGVTDRRESARLEVLRALERGDVDIETASRRLEALEDAGPRYFRGWC
jgi:hypothetical protein